MNKLDKIIESYLEGAVDPEEFSSQFETEYNFGESQSQDTRRQYRTVFDVVTRYSPFEKEVERIPHYIGEREMRQFVQRFVTGS